MPPCRSRPPSRLTPPRSSLSPAFWGGSPRTDPSWTVVLTCHQYRKTRPETPSRIPRPSLYGMEDFWTTVGQAAQSPNPPLAYTAAETPTHPLDDMYARAQMRLVAEQSSESLSE